VHLMSQSQVHLLASAAIAACWGAFALAWLSGALYNASRGPAKHTGVPFGSGMLIGAVIVWVIFRVVPAADWQSVTVQAVWVRLLGLAILLGATAFTLWARLALGTMWSSAPMVKQEHQLRTDGPYGITRHPIYTGILAMLAGTALLAGTGRWILIFPVGLAVAEIKIRMEEGLMLAAFPRDYPRYRRRVPQLVPGLRLFLRGREPAA
jgi:protein-S-isoprenylcysteine O-methyltransferase Ste14